MAKGDIYIYILYKDSRVGKITCNIGEVNFSSRRAHENRQVPRPSAYVLAICSRENPKIGRVSADLQMITTIC